MQRQEPTGVRRILVVANETVAGRQLLQEIERRAADGEHEVLVVSPALAPRLRFLVSDVDGGIRQAEERMRESVDALTRAGVNARGEVGDSDPLLAIEDALSQFPADEIVISTHQGPLELAREAGRAARRGAVRDPGDARRGRSRGRALGDARGRARRRSLTRRAQGCPGSPAGDTLPPRRPRGEE